MAAKRSNPTVVDSLSGPGPPLIVPPPRCGLMSASPLGPAKQCVRSDNPPPHQPPHQTPHLGHGQRQQCGEAVADMVGAFFFRGSAVCVCACTTVR